MRLFAIPVMVAAFIQSASAHLETINVDPTDTPKAGGNAYCEGLRTLQTLSTRLEAAGYHDVVVMPKVVLVQAKDNLGNPAVMIVNSETLEAVQLKVTIGGETIGSGSSHERPRFEKHRTDRNSSTRDRR
jgi:hypothetical protein